MAMVKTTTTATALQLTTYDNCQNSKMELLASVVATVVATTTMTTTTTVTSHRLDISVQ